ncbi:hypothetical protein EDC30_1236 [Paucimonas lemoignei]|uniref:Uncharacterized protein n=2 Tax=Paucimonas lemoignei TaxID=29443 RepID=A0A4R3HQI6_PAULE|nr:hypothetical protein EDC30_1236 [Paucimonas lemoignei]
MRRYVAIFLGVVAVYGLCTYDAYKTYYDYRQLCVRDGGLQLFQKVERNVGWSAEDLNVAKGYQRLLKDLAFVRAPNANGEMVDVTYKGVGVWGADASYNMPGADFSKPVRYHINVTTQQEKESSRIHKGIVTVTDLKTGKVAYQWNQYSFYWRHTDQPIRSLLVPSGVIRCPRSDTLPNFNEINARTYK